MAVFDAVFEGGGAKGVALSGGVRGVQSQGHTLRRLVGTSAGAITATNLAVGYAPDDILRGSLEKGPDGRSVYASFTDAPALDDATLAGSTIGHALHRLGNTAEMAVLHAALRVGPLRELLSLTEKGGLYGGDAFLQWMRKCLDDDGRGLADATFAEVFEHTGRDLSIVATDTTARRMLVLNHRTAPKCPVSWAVRMSMSIPLYWQEVPWRAEWGRYLGEEITGHAVVDGGVVSNFPLHLIADPDDDEVVRWMGPADRDPSVRPLGFLLDPDLEVPGAPAPAAPAVGHRGLVARLSALLDTMMEASDNEVLQTHARFVCRLPVKGYGTTEFDQPEPRVRALYDAGTQAAIRYLSEVP